MLAWHPRKIDSATQKTYKYSEKSRGPTIFTKPPFGVRTIFKYTALSFISIWRARSLDMKRAWSSIQLVLGLGLPLLPLMVVMMYTSRKNSRIYSCYCLELFSLYYTYCVTVKYLISAGKLKISE